MLLQAIYRRLAAITAMLSLLLTAARANAYARTRPLGRLEPTRWPRASFQLTLRTRELPADVERADVLAALERAARTWSSPDVDCTALQIHVRDGAAEPSIDRRDGENSVSSHARHFCRGGRMGTSDCYDERMTAVTTVAFGETRNGEVEIAEADIDINAKSFQWTTRSTGSGDPRLDLQATLVHEIGHALGLADNCAIVGALHDHRGARLPGCDGADADARNAVMFPLTSHGLRVASGPRRRLSEDDRAGVCALYPKPGWTPAASPRGPAQPPMQRGFGCTATFAGEVSSPWGWLWMVLGWPVVRRRRPR